MLKNGAIAHGVSDEQVKLSGLPLETKLRWSLDASELAGFVAIDIHVDKRSPRKEAVAPSDTNGSSGNKLRETPSISPSEHLP